MARILAFTAERVERFWPGSVWDTMIWPMPEAETPQEAMNGFTSAAPARSMPTQA